MKKDGSVLNLMRLFGHQKSSLMLIIAGEGFWKFVKDYSKTVRIDFPWFGIMNGTYLPYNNNGEGHEGKSYCVVGSNLDLSGRCA